MKSEVSLSFSHEFVSSLCLEPDEFLSTPSLHPILRPILILSCQPRPSKVYFPFRLTGIVCILLNSHTCYLCHPSRLSCLDLNVGVRLQIMMLLIKFSPVFSSFFGTCSQTPSVCNLLRFHIQNNM